MGPRVIFSAGFWDAVPSGLGLGETALAWVKTALVVDARYTALAIGT